MEVVDCEGKGGGIAVSWRRVFSMAFKSKSKNHIDRENCYSRTPKDVASLE
jgi:hypothetical protein